MMESSEPTTREVNATTNRKTQNHNELRCCQPDHLLDRTTLDRAMEIQLLTEG